MECAIPDMEAACEPPPAPAKTLAAALPSTTCSKPCEPFNSMARVRLARTYRSKKIPYPARTTHLDDGLQARPIRGLKLFVSWLNSDGKRSKSYRMPKSRVTFRAIDQ